MVIRASMPRRISRSVLLLIMLSGLLPAVGIVSGQEASPKNPALAKDRAAAVVMGQAIPHSEVEAMAARLREQNPDESEANLYWYARRGIAERILLIETAKLYAEDVSEEEVRRYYSYAYEIEEKEMEEDFENFQEQYLIRLYLDCRMGLSERLKGVSPDFADFIRVTPEEIKSAFRQYKATVTADPQIKVAQFLFPKAAFSRAGELDSSLQQCLEALKDQPPDQTKLEALAARWPGCLFLVKEAASLQEKIARFAREAKQGDVSEPIELEKGVVIAYLLQRKETVPLNFDAYQEQYMQTLKMRKMNRVQQFIMDELIQQADYYPEDLFKPNALRKPPPAKPGS